jgi:hypothetical protein
LKSFRHSDWSATEAALLVALLSATGSSLAAEVPHAGITLSTSGEVWAMSEDARKRPLERRSKIFETDELGTGATSNAKFRMKDGAVFSLGESTNLKISEYRYAAAGDPSDRASMELIEGTLRFVSGAIGKQNHDDWTLKAGEASIGIRGTEGEVSNRRGQVTITITEGRIVIFDPECPEPITLGRGSKYNTLKIDEVGCSTSYTPTPFSELPPEVFTVPPTDNEQTETGGGGGGRPPLASPN